MGCAFIISGLLRRIEAREGGEIASSNADSLRGDKGLVKTISSRVGSCVRWMAERLEEKQEMAMS